jgi:hypothetical protein
MAITGGFGDLGDNLKVLYPDVAVEAMVNDEQVVRPLLARDLPSDARVTEGVVRFGAYFNKPNNVAQILDGDTLAYLKDRTLKYFEVKPTLFCAGFQIGWMTKYAANTSKSAFNGGEQRMRTEETASDLGKFMEQSYASVVEGIRGYVDADGSNTITMQKPIGARLLREGNLISVRQTAGGAVRDSIDGRVITDINPDTLIVTYDGADQTAVQGDPVYVVSDGGSLTGGATQTLTAAFCNSIRAAVDDGTLTTTWHGLTRSSYRKSKGQVFANGGTVRNLTESVLMDACRIITERSGKRPQVALTGFGQCQKYVEYVAPARRFPTQGRTKQGMATGYQEEDLVHYAPGVTLTFKGSVDIIPRELFLLNMDTFFMYTAKAPGWMDEDVLLHLTPASGRFKASWQAFMGAVENLGCRNPWGNGVVRDLADPIYADEIA